VSEIWIDGAFTAAPASIPTDDRGLLLGDGLFETIRWAGDGCARLDAHLKRLRQGAAFFGIPVPASDPEIAIALAELARRNGFSNLHAALRLTLTRGSGARGLAPPDAPKPRLFAAAAPLGPAPGPAKLAISAIRRNPFSPSSTFKTLAYTDNIAALRAARAAGADDALLLDVFGRLAGASAANLFVIKGRRIITPALETGALPGTVRAAILELAMPLGLPRVEQEAGGIETLKEADAAFLTSALIGVRAIAAVDGQALDATHPLIERFAHALRA
jgi:branched-chain amino acid aminotransferase/4-amino-4-deoxychorismate lyase